MKGCKKARLQKRQKLSFSGSNVGSIFGAGRGNGGGGGAGPRNPFGGPSQPRPRNNGQNPASKSVFSSRPLRATITILVLLVAGIGVASTLWAELAWYQQLGRISIVLTTWGWKIGLVAIGALFVAVVVWANLAIAAKSSPFAAARNRAANRKNAEKKMDEAKRRAQQRDATEPRKGDTTDTAKTKGADKDEDEVVDLELEFDKVEDLADDLEAELRRETLKRDRIVVSDLHNLLEPWRRVLLILAPLAAGVAIAMPLSSSWNLFAVWFQRSSFGAKDPIFSQDASFFVFTLPVAQQLVTLVFYAFVTAGLFVMARYYLQGNLSTAIENVPSRTRIHLSVLLAILSLILAARYYLQRFDLLMGTHDKFSGASYTDIHAVLPAKNILVGISLVVAVLFIIGAFRKTWAIPATGVGVMVLSAILVGGAYPWLVQRFQVDPSAQELEAPYISHNIAATRDAFGIADVKEETYTATTEATAGQLRQDSESTTSIRLLDPAVVSRTFGQLEQNRQYYRFDQNLSVDRYKIDSKVQDTVIAVRELDTAQLGESQQSWVNQHTVFTHGFGVVAAYGSKVSADGAPDFWEQGIPSQGALGEYEPRIYFGKYSPEYSIVGGAKGSAPQEFDYPSDASKDKGVNNTFSGKGGPSIGNLWERLMYAIKFQSSEIFFSKQVNADSQILFHRNPIERVAMVAPYLTLDSKVYPAVVDMDNDPKTPKRVVWIIDGYTTSNSYPYSNHVELNTAIADSRSNYDGIGLANRVNYMRNSVKAVVDAYDGSVTLYQWDADDPVINAWGKVFPGQLQPASKISGDLMSHLRYPEDLFKVQRNLIARYHTTDPKSFYSGSDFWNLPDDPTHEGSTTVISQLQPPYYLTMQAPGQSNAEFSLYSTYIPYGRSDRNVLTGYLTVDSETGDQAGKVRNGYGKMTLLSLPSDLAVPGPGQVSNKFKTTDSVSQTLNLLSQQSTDVVRGNLLTLPVGGGLLYVQPVYVQGKSGTSYPLLRFVLTSFGDKIGFAPTLQGSLDQLFGGDSGAVTSEDADAGSDDGGGGGDKAASNLTREQQLALALEAASKAMADGQEALKNGDWSAYGKAQEELKKQLQLALTFGGGTEAAEATAGATAEATAEATKQARADATAQASPNASAKASVAAKS